MKAATKKTAPTKSAVKKTAAKPVPEPKKAASKASAPKGTGAKKAILNKALSKKLNKLAPRPGSLVPAATDQGPGPAAAVTVLDRLHAVIVERREADPARSHSARLLSRGMAKVAQKFGEEAVECLIEAVAGNTDAMVAESADVLYHLLVMWVAAGVDPQAVWAELARREGVSGITEKAGRPTAGTTTKIP